MGTRKVSTEEAERIIEESFGNIKKFENDLKERRKRSRLAINPTEETAGSHEK